MLTGAVAAQWRGRVSQRGGLWREWTARSCRIWTSGQERKVATAKDVGGCCG